MFFPSLISYMSSGPIIVYVISKENAISKWLEIIGPTNSIKAKAVSPERYNYYLIKITFIFINVLKNKIIHII